jgi:hypothetical protein
VKGWDSAAFDRWLTTEPEPVPEPGAWYCLECGWCWPLPGDPSAGDECDPCGGELVQEQETTSGLETPEGRPNSGQAHP